MRFHFRSIRTNKAICTNNGTPSSRAIGAITTDLPDRVTCKRCLRAMEIQAELAAKRAARAAAAIVVDTPATTEA